MRAETAAQPGEQEAPGKRTSPYRGGILGVWEVIASPTVLDVGARRPPTCDAGHGFDQPTYISLGRVDTGARSHGPGRSRAIAPAHLVAEIGDLLLSKAKETHQVGTGTETAVPHPDAFLCREPCRHEGTWQALHREGRDRQGIGAQLRSEDTHTRYGRQPAAQQLADWRSWARMAGHPISASVSIAACRATAPRRFAEPASSRSGGMVPTTRG